LSSTHQQQQASNWRRERIERLTWGSS